MKVFKVRSRFKQSIRHRNHGTKNLTHIYERGNVKRRLTFSLQPHHAWNQYAWRERSVDDLINEVGVLGPRRNLEPLSVDLGCVGQLHSQRNVSSGVGIIRTAIA